MFSDKLANPGWNAQLQLGDIVRRNGASNRWSGSRNPAQSTVLVSPPAPHLLISEFTQDLLNRLYWSRTPNINCDQTKYSAKIWLKKSFLNQTKYSDKIWSEKIFFELKNQILGGGILLHGATGDRRNYAGVTNITVRSDKYNR